MDVQHYLNRIAFTGTHSPTPATLTRLQTAHVLSAPFENLDIHYGNPITLDLASIYHKIIERRRGGFCYELNGLFHALLKKLGFEVQRISARVYDKEKGFGQEFDHLVNLVTFGQEKYLTDVGFGEFCFAPLKVKLDTPQQDPRGLFRITQRDETYLQVSKQREGTWEPEYIFSLKERRYSEYEEMCHYHQTSPDSHFTQKPFCTLPTPDGRITLAGDKLKITDQKGKQETDLGAEGAFEEALWKYFGIKMEG